MKDTRKEQSALELVLEAEEHGALLSRLRDEIRRVELRQQELELRAALALEAVGGHSATFIVEKDTVLTVRCHVVRDGASKKPTWGSISVDRTTAHRAGAGS